jgi:uncharacterized protein YceH (UPF0502 family)
MIELSAVEARVAGVLMEKESTTPEYYPLSLNATMNACNQKSSREPVMQLSEADVRTALFALEELGMVRVIADARVSKFEHRMREGVGGQALRRDEVAVSCLLLLRGPQTPAELRARAERMYGFDDNAAVTATLDRLAAREEPLVVLLARQPGAREARWMHLLCGAVDPAMLAGESRSSTGEKQVLRAAQDDKSSGLAARIEELEDWVRSLEARLVALEVEREETAG